MHATPFAPLSDSPTNQTRSRLFRVMLGVLVVAQLIAFWLLCSQQVNKAQARHTELTVHQAALADCLQFTAGSTIATCTNQLQAGNRRAASPGMQAMAGATTVSFNPR